MTCGVNSVQSEEKTSGNRTADAVLDSANSAIEAYMGAVINMNRDVSPHRKPSTDRRQRDSGRLGRRATDVWMPYSTTFVAQLIGQSNSRPT